MLAYVFWHWHVPQINAQDYQTYLIDFHQTLFAHQPPGFHHTRVLQEEQASWLSRDATTYEDWHTVENSAALDPLNERAVTGPCLEPHQRVAHWTEGSAAAIYQMVLGNSALPSVRFAYRFNKPAGMTYAELRALLRPLTEAQGCLWQRYMNLGPGPEFCLHSAEVVTLPANLSALSLPVTQICFTLSNEQ